jgi:hypothetical protein
MIYIRAGLYAEGRTDYEFLLPLVNQLLNELAAKLFSGAYELAETLGIDAPYGTSGGRADKIRLALEKHLDYCDIFILHADGAGDPDEARRTQINPGANLARMTIPHSQIHLVACVPVREIEAWLLADPRPFERILGKTTPIVLPGQPEAEIDPKNLLRKICRDGASRIPLSEAYRSFGENVRLEKLRTLSAFRRFEDELEQALKALGSMYGHAEST